MSFRFRLDEAWRSAQHAQGGTTVLSRAELIACLDRADPDRVGYLGALIPTRSTLTLLRMAVAEGLADELRSLPPTRSAFTNYFAGVDRRERLVKRLARRPDDLGKRARAIQVQRQREDDQEPRWTKELVDGIIELNSRRAAEGKPPIAAADYLRERTA